MCWKLERTKKEGWRVQTYKKNGSVVELRRKMMIACWNLEEEGKLVGSYQKKDSVLEVTGRRIAWWKLQEE